MSATCGPSDRQQLTEIGVIHDLRFTLQVCIGRLNEVCDSAGIELLISTRVILCKVESVTIRTSTENNNDLCSILCQHNHITREGRNETVHELDEVIRVGSVNVSDYKIEL